MDLQKIVAHPAYPFAAAGIAIAAGAGIGALTELISRKLEERKAGENLGEDWWDGAYASDDGSYPTVYPPIPEGINELPSDKAEVGELFVKPDISKAVDYTRFHKAAQSLHDIERDLNEKATVASEEELPGVFELIDEEEFVRGAGNSDGYAVASGTYFTQERILAGWNEDLMEKEVTQTVGSAAVSKFDDPSVKAVYVRNTQLKVLFEIVRCDDAMEEALQESIVMNEPGTDGA